MRWLQLGEALCPRLSPCGYSEELEAREGELKLMLKDISEGKNSKGFGVAFYKTLRKGIVDYTKIPELEVVDLDKYRKEPSEVWTVRRVSM